MNKIKALNGLIITLILAITISCSNTDDNESSNYELTYAISVEHPSEGIVGETLNIIVSFRVMNGCGEFGRFIERGDGLTKTIEIEAKYEGLICTMDLPIRQIKYEFTPNIAGVYVYRFKSGPDFRFGESGQDEYLTVKVLVKEE